MKEQKQVSITSSLRPQTLQPRLPQLLPHPSLGTKHLTCAQKHTIRPRPSIGPKQLSGTHLPRPPTYPLQHVSQIRTKVEQNPPRNWTCQGPMGRRFFGVNAAPSGKIPIQRLNYFKGRLESGNNRSDRYASCLKGWMMVWCVDDEGDVVGVTGLGLVAVCGTIYQEGMVWYPNGLKSGVGIMVHGLARDVRRYIHT
jgi:hypothetical protein